MFCRGLLEVLALTTLKLLLASPPPATHSLSVFCSVSVFGFKCAKMLLKGFYKGLYVTEASEF